ncbi:LPXTG cell wall anchor domain-containing protein [Streptomyces sp. NRRL S-378]|uniref:LPXTG cell wall anchor domain-containing protein n=1 Tax=Streptomyces sp. NRRL S-378 TaxID=1463904 RepID=UPI00131CB726|nr:LPXTG cell wall anchor domain-containing protein [Streptomyces sp. NRRL S-378]
MNRTHSIAARRIGAALATGTVVLGAATAAQAAPASTPVSSTPVSPTPVSPTPVTPATAIGEQGSNRPEGNPDPVGGLVTSEELLDTTVENGQKQSLRLGFKVTGDNPVQGAELGVHLPPGLELNPQERPSNCEHFKVDPVREYRDEYLFCSFTGTFEPGKYYRLDTGLNITATPELWRDLFYVSWTPGGQPMYKPQQGGVKGNAAAIKVIPAEPFKEWRFWGREVPVENPANQPDFTVDGATGSGPAGGQVLLDPGWQIKGTGSVATTAADDNVVETEFVLPPGISFVGGRPGPEGRRVFGGTGGSVKGVFKIESWVKPGTYHGEYRYKADRGPGHLKIADIDRDLRNNAAGLTITVTPADGQQPSPSTSASASPSPSGSTSTSPSASATTAPSTGNTPGPNGGTGGILANTGSAAQTAGALAAVTLTLGGALYALARRRRSA